ncbi:MAG: Phosphoenolpyruvate carboxylase, partial [uncultured Thermomicrobiales bacterium]
RAAEPRDRRHRHRRALRDARGWGRGRVRRDRRRVRSERVGGPPDHRPAGVAGGGADPGTLDRPAQSLRRRAAPRPDRPLAALPCPAGRRPPGGAGGAPRRHPPQHQRHRRRPADHWL